MPLKKRIFRFNPTLLFWLGIVALCIPIFSMGYVLSLDGPTHWYNANLFNQLFFEKNEFISSYISFNSELTPNYVGLVWTALLLKVFSPIVALKVFHLSYIVGLLLSFKYLIESFSETKPSKWTLTLLLPFVFSFFFICGFINFYLAFIPMFLTAGYYIRQKNLKLKNVVIIALGILFTYLTHSIVFGFLIVLLGSLEFTRTILINRNIIDLLRKASVIILLSIIPIILTFLFLGSRESNTEYLNFWELFTHLFQMKSIRMFNTQSNILYTFFSALIFILTAWIISNSIRKKNVIRIKDSILLAAFIFLTLYFILPDSVGFASVFSVRIEYMFWMSMVVWIILSLKNAYLSVFTSVLTLLMVIWNVSIIKSQLLELNSFGKRVVSASESIPSNSVVYPIFASNEWNHFHFSNLLGLQKPLLILENGAARQDYFPLQYNKTYEECFKQTPSKQFNCASQSLTVDYLIIIGNEWIGNDYDQQIIQSLNDYDSIVYQDLFLKVYKLSTND